MLIPEDLYAQIRKTMPIPCVDVIVVDGQRRILLLRRANEPARNEWWFAGGRVLFRETREEAAIRKVSEECGLRTASVRELGTFDVMFDKCETGAIHGITTLFLAEVEHGSVLLDPQSVTADWRTREAWSAEQLHPFVSRGIQLTARS